MEFDATPPHVRASPRIACTFERFVMDVRFIRRCVLCIGRLRVLLSRTRSPPLYMKMFYYFSAIHSVASILLLSSSRLPYDKKRREKKKMFLLARQCCGRLALPSSNSRGPDIINCLSSCGKRQRPSPSHSAPLLRNAHKRSPPHPYRGWHPPPLLFLTAFFALAFSSCLSFFSASRALYDHNGVGCGLGGVGDAGGGARPVVRAIRRRAAHATQVRRRGDLVQRAPPPRPVL